MVERVVEVARLTVGQRVVVVVAVVTALTTVATLGTVTTVATVTAFAAATLATLRTLRALAALPLLIPLRFGDEHTVRQFILTGLRVDLEQFDVDFIALLNACRLDRL